MEQKKTHPTTPHFSRQVNKLDKNETLQNNSVSSNKASDETILIEIPKQYEPILLTVIRFLRENETGKKKQTYADFSSKIKELWRTEKKWEANTNKTQAEEKGLLHPLVYMYINGVKTFLTKEDAIILLEYPFNVNSRHILLTLVKMGVRTLKGLEPRIGIIYHWKICEDWKTREKNILRRYWDFERNRWGGYHEIKDDIYLEIEEGKFDDKIEEIKQRIIRNHS